MLEYALGKQLMTLIAQCKADYDVIRSELIEGKKWSSITV
jgi:hypothetical protein